MLKKKEKKKKKSVYCNNFGALPYSSNKPLLG